MPPFQMEMDTACTEILSILLPTHLLSSTVLVLEDCPVTLEDVLCIFHICFTLGQGVV